MLTSLPFLLLHLSIGLYVIDCTQYRRVVLVTVVDTSYPGIRVQTHTFENRYKITGRCSFFNILYGTICPVRGLVRIYMKYSMISRST